MSSENQCFFKDQEFCGDTFISLHELRHERFASTVFPGARSCIEIMLLRSDLFYQPVLRLRRTYVCMKHKADLLKEFCRSMYRKCCVCVSCFGKSAASAAVQNIAIPVALTLYEQFQFLHSYGKPICRRCRGEIMKRIDSTRINQHQSAMDWLKDIAWSDEESDDSIRDPDSHSSPVSITPSSSIRDDLDNSKSKRAALNNFIQLMRPDRSLRSLLVTHPYNQLTKGSKRNFLSSTEFVIDVVLEFLAGSDFNLVRQELFSERNNRNKTIMDAKLMSILTAVAEAYNNADSSSSRRTILSIIAKQVDYNMISSVIPGLTRYRYTAARLYAEEYGKGMVMVPSPRTNIRYYPIQVDHFIDFVLSPHVSTDLPFGEKTLRLSNGAELQVPDSIRSMDSTHIIQQYYEYRHQMCSNFAPLGSSSLYKILDCCKASTRKALQGLNNFIPDGVAAFEGLKNIIENFTINPNDKMRLTTNLQRAKQYLQSDFKLHVSRSSYVPDHCILFALSERNSQFYSSPCDHSHDEICIECMNLKSVLFDIKEHIKSFKSQETIDRSLYDYDDFVESILAWKSHLLRCVNQDQCRTTVLRDITVNEIFLNLDWAMK